MNIISIVLPCYQEEKNIYKNTIKLYQYMSKHLPEGEIEIILINDGSTDNTRKEIERIGKKIPQVKVVSYKENKGKGYAVTQGLRVSNGNIICMYDSDGDIPKKFLIKYVQKLLSDKKLEIIIGSKLVEGSSVDVSLKRKIMSHTNNLINSILFDLPVGDTQVGLKVFRKKIKHIFLDNVTTFGYAFDIDFLFHVHNAGYTITEKNISLQIDSAESQVTPIRILYFLRDILLLFKKVSYKILRKKTSIKNSFKIYTLRSIVIPAEKALSTVLYLYKILISSNK